LRQSEAVCTPANHLAYIEAPAYANCGAGCPQFMMLVVTNDVSQQSLIKSSRTKEG
jgi:hypothetical protein